MTWTEAYISNLPDSAFAVIEAGGTKDGDGRRRRGRCVICRIATPTGRSTPDHVRDALARLSQTQISDALKTRALGKLRRAAKSVGVRVSEADMVTDDASLEGRIDDLVEAWNEHPLSNAMAYVRGFDDQVHREPQWRALQRAVHARR